MAGSALGLLGLLGFALVGTAAISDAAAEPRQEELAAACLAGDGAACSEADWDDPASVHLLQRAASARLASGVARGSGGGDSGVVRHAAGAAAAGSKVKGNATMRVSAGGPGHMTMWSASESTVVGGACQFANPGLGGLRASSAASPYVHSKMYCAGNKKTFAMGDACGRCFEISYDGAAATDAGRPGSTIIQVVDSGADAEFDCELAAFKTITGSITGIFPISYSQVPCEVSPGGQVATVLAANRYFMIAIFANSHSPARKATFIQGGKEFPMKRRGSTFSVEKGPGTGAVSFVVVNEDGTSASFNDCFTSWPQPLGKSCSSTGGAVGPHPHATPTPAPTTPAPATPAPTPTPETTAAPTPVPETSAPAAPQPGTTAAPTPAPEPTAPETTAAPEGTTPAPPPPQNEPGCLQRYDQCGGDPAMSGEYVPGAGQRCCANDDRGPLQCSLWNGFFSQCVGTDEDIHHASDDE